MSEWLYHQRKRRIILDWPLRPFVFNDTLEQVAMNLAIHIIHMIILAREATTMQHIAKNPRKTCVRSGIQTSAPSLKVKRFMQMLSH